MSCGLTGDQLRVYLSWECPTGWRPPGVRLRWWRPDGEMGQAKWGYYIGWRWLGFGFVAQWHKGNV